MNNRWPLRHFWQRPQRRIVLGNRRSLSWSIALINANLVQYLKMIGALSVAMAIEANGKSADFFPRSTNGFPTATRHLHQLESSTLARQEERNQNEIQLSSIRFQSASLLPNPIAGTLRTEPMDPLLFGFYTFPSTLTVHCGLNHGLQVGRKSAIHTELHPPKHVHWWITYLFNSIHKRRTALVCRQPKHGVIWIDDFLVGHQFTNGARQSQNGI